MKRQALLVPGATLDKEFKPPKPPRELKGGEVFANVMGEWQIVERVLGRESDFDPRRVYSSDGLPIHKDEGYAFVCGHQLDVGGWA